MSLPYILSPIKSYQNIINDRWHKYNIKMPELANNGAQGLKVMREIHPSIVFLGDILVNLCFPIKLPPIKAYVSVINDIINIITSNKKII